MVRVTYTLPEQTRTVIAGGREYVERIPNHPTRLARDTDWNCWYEDANTHFMHNLDRYTEAARQNTLKLIGRECL